MYTICAQGGMSRDVFVHRESLIFYRANIHVLTLPQLEGFIATFESEYSFAEQEYRMCMAATLGGLVSHTIRTNKNLEVVATMKTVILPILRLCPTSIEFRRKAVLIVGRLTAEIYAMELELV